MDEIPVDMEESEEYRDDDFDSSENSAALVAAAVTVSGKLPPLSGSYPYGADEKSLSQSFQQSKEDIKKSSDRKHNSSAISGLSGRDVAPSRQVQTSNEKKGGMLSQMIQPEPFL